MSIQPYCPPGHTPAIVDNRKRIYDHNLPRPLYDDLPPDEYNSRLAYFNENPLELVTFNWKQTGPNPYSPTARVVICFSTLAVRDIPRITSTKNPTLPNEPSAQTHQGPFYYLEDTYIIPIKRGFHQSSPIYQYITNEQRENEYADKCIFQDTLTGSFYIRTGTRQENQCYPYGTYCRVESGGILHIAGGHNHYWRLPRHNAISVTGVLRDGFT
jgi:hypothetical protein